MIEMTQRYPRSLRAWAFGANQSPFVALVTGVPTRRLQSIRRFGRARAEEVKALADFFNVSEQQMRAAIRDAKRHRESLAQMRDF